MIRKDRKSKVDFLNRLVNGAASISELVETTYQAWFQDMEEKGMYCNHTTGQRLPLEEVRTLAKENGRIHLILVNRDRKLNQESYETTDQGRED